MPSLESHKPFEAEFKKPLVSTKDRAAIQVLLIKQSGADEAAWVAEYADDVSRAFVQDPVLVALAKTDHVAAAKHLKKALDEMRGL